VKFSDSKLKYGNTLGIHVSMDLKELLRKCASKKPGMNMFGLIYHYFKV
jgi:hypothetical protein